MQMELQVRTTHTTRLRFTYILNGIDRLLVKYLGGQTELIVRSIKSTNKKKQKKNSQIKCIQQKFKTPKAHASNTHNLVAPMTVRHHPGTFTPHHHQSPSRQTAEQR